MLKKEEDCLIIELVRLNQSCDLNFPVYIIVMKSMNNCKTLCRSSSMSLDLSQWGNHFFDSMDGGIAS